MLRQATSIIVSWLIATTIGISTVSAAEQLTGKVPEGWIMAVDKQVGELTVQEFFPPDTSGYWSQKVVFESLTTADLPDPLEYAKGLATQQADRCEAFTQTNIFSGFENQYPTVVSVLQCGTNKLTGKPIITLIKLIRGNQSLYTISRIWRLDPKPTGLTTAPTTPPAVPSATEPSTAAQAQLLNRQLLNKHLLNKPENLISQGEFAAWSQTLRAITLCDPELAAHTCTKSTTQLSTQEGD